MDPFGSTYPSNGFKSRGSSLSHSSDGGLKGFTGAMTGVAKDVGAQLSSRGRSWSHVGGYLGAANSIYGCLVVAWVVIALLQHGAFGLGLGLGACTQCLLPLAPRRVAVCAAWRRFVCSVWVPTS